MAKRSDLAQKLLDDLRLRKERMAASQRSSHSHQLPLDAYAYSKQTYRGSRSTKANEIVTSRTGNMLSRSSRCQGSARNGGVSNQIVPYGKGQSSLKMNDMSLDLAFAFENGGKLSRADSSHNSSTMAFLHQIKRGTMEFSMVERQSNLVRKQASTNHFQALSPMQINQISKGAQKLNQILRASSNDLNIDRYSIEFAKELFQGAINLEESLRMLVDMQKSSEFMISPQRKSKITLLEEDGDDDDDKTIKTSEQKQLARTTFSLDKSSRHTLMQRQIIVNYSNEGKNSNNKKQDGKTSKASLKLPASSSSDIKNLKANSEQKKQLASLQSNPEKGKIPNVIAKLMGLDNLPEKAELKHMPQKDSGYTQKIGGNHGMTSQRTTRDSTKKTEHNKQTTQKLVAVEKQKVIEAFNMPATQEEELIFGANKKLLIQKASSEVLVHNEKPLRRDLDGIKSLKGFENHYSAAQMTLVTESQKTFWGKGRKQDHANSREQKTTAKSRTNDPTLNNMLAKQEEVNERSEVKSSLPEEKEINRSNIQLVTRHTNKHTVNYQKKSQNHLGVQNSDTLSKFRSQAEKHHREQWIQQMEKKILLAIPKGGSELASKNSSIPHNRFINSQKQQQNQATSFKKIFAANVDAMNMKPEGFLCSYYDDLVRHESSNDTKIVKDMINRKSDGMITLVDEESVHKLANIKVNNTRRQNVGIPGKIGEVLNVKNRRKLFIKQVKQQKEAEARIISSNESVVAAETLDERHPPHKEAELPPTLYSSDGGELHSLQGQVALASNDLDQYLHSVTTNDLQGHAAPLPADEELKTGESALNTKNGIQEDRTGIINHSQRQDQNISEKRIQEPLTEGENCLKWILAMSQSFLNTAEALFRFNIPFRILQGVVQDNQGKDSKLILDCGYEVMKRKGTQEELKVYPCSKISISNTINIRSLDDLVRKLNKDMEKLKFYGRNRSSLADVEDYLPKMLEHDVYNRDPDINCMWGFSWNEETFAFMEKCVVIRDMEKVTLNVLLDEITADLLLVQGGQKMTTIDK